MMGHEEVRASLGAYAIGALEPAERHEVERHLPACASCRAELAALAPLPGLLARLDRDAALNEEAVDPALADRLVAAVAAERHQERQTLRRWRTVAAVAATVALVLGALGVVSLVTRPDGSRGGVASATPNGTPIPVQIVDASTAGTLNGTVRPDPKVWGTSVELQLWDLPAKPQFALMVVAKDGRREQAGAWSITKGGQCLVTGATSIQAADIARFEIVLPGGPVLAQAEV